MRRWQGVVERFPRDEGAKSSLARVRWSASLSKISVVTLAESQGATSVRGLRSDTDQSEVMGQFESLGENCEFGLVQRYHNLEPLGLLRFSYIHEASLLDLLKTHFRGVGDPEHTQLDTNDNEYLTSDKRFGLTAHTYVAPHSVDREVFFREQCKRISFLRKKLLRDLENAQKIFIVTAHRPSSSDGSAFALHAALKEYGPNRLLYVRAEMPDLEPGSVKHIEDGLFFGNLDRWGGNRNGTWSISQDIWLKLCQGTISALSE